MKLVGGAGETASACARSHAGPSGAQNASLLFLRALLDRSNSGVPLSDRAWLRASSLMSRAIFLNGARVHRCLSVQVLRVVTLFGDVISSELSH
jgi:hypothetical protein